MKTFRKGNIEYRICHRSLEPHTEYVEIVRWYPNDLYGRQKDAEMTVYGSYRYNGVLVDGSLFDIKEVCYTLATIDTRESPSVVCVGLRPFELEGDDADNFKEVLAAAYEYAEEAWKNSVVE